MATEVTPARLAPQIVSMLAGLRRRIYAYVWCEGLAVGVAWLGAAFWISLAFDWCVEPPVWVRQGMIGLTAIGLRVYSLSLHPPPGLAADRRPQSGAGAGAAIPRFRRKPVDHGRTDRAARSRQLLSSANAGRRRARGNSPHGRRAAGRRVSPRAAGAQPASGGGGDCLGRGLCLRSRRNRSQSGKAASLPPFSNEPWPRRVHLSIEGFDNPEHRVVVAKGADLTVVAKADTQYEVPETVQIRYRTEEGRSRENMSRVGVAGPDDAVSTLLVRVSRHSFFAHVRHFRRRRFAARLSDRRRRCADDRIGAALRISGLHADACRAICRPDRSKLPQGSKITVHATANKDLVEASIQRLSVRQGRSAGHDQARRQIRSPPFLLHDRSARRNADAAVHAVRRRRHP